MKSQDLQIDIYAFSSNGAKLCDKLIENMKGYKINAYVPEKYVNSAEFVNLREDNLYRASEKSFNNKDCIIYVGAVGIGVRAIAPFIRSKKYDPAVICIDDKGQNVIPILSGHMGGANKLALRIAGAIGANPVITTATDINGKFAVDEWASNNNLHIMSLKKARDIAASILENEKVAFESDFKVEGDLPAELGENTRNIGISISLDPDKMPFESTLKLIPKIVSLGVGCRKGTSFEDVYKAVREVLKKNKISHFAIKSINSIDLKKDEPAIIRTAEVFKVPFYTYSKDKLQELEGEFSESAFVRNVTGLDSVCERAALMGSQTNKLIIKKTIINSVTVAASIDDYIVNINQ